MLNDDRLRQALRDEGGGSDPDALVRELRRRFERRWKLNRIYYTCFMCLGLLMASWGAQDIYQGASVQAQFRALVPFLIGVTIIVSTQIWLSVAEYWLVVTQGVKELQLQVAAMEERIADQEGGTNA